MQIFRFFFLITLTFLLVDVQAQNYTQSAPLFGKERLNVQIGIGLTPTFIGQKSKMTTPPLSVSLDYMLSERFSIGMYGAYSVTESNPEIFFKNSRGTHYAENLIPTGGITGQWENTYSEAGLRLGVHVIHLSNCDFYGGLNIGVRNSQVKDMLPNMKQLNKFKDIQPQNTSFAYGGFVGVSCAFSNRLGGFAEAGTGASLLKVGVNFGLVSSKKYKEKQKRDAKRVQDTSK